MAISYITGQYEPAQGFLQIIAFSCGGRENLTAAGKIFEDVKFSQRLNFSLIMGFRCLLSAGKGLPM